MQRRSALAAGTLGLWACGAARSAATGAWQALKLPSAMAQIAAGGPSGLLGISERGSLYALALDHLPARQLAEGLAPDTPLALGHQRIAARRLDGGLWIFDAGRVGSSAGVVLAPAAGLLVLPAAVIGIEADGVRARAVRLEPDGTGTWRRVARSEVETLPDARLLQADMDGNGDGGHVVLLAGPDANRYPHGVLGDTVEATRIVLLERHNLAVMRKLVLDAPHVLEDLAPRRVALAARDGVLSVRAGPEGGQLVLIDADPHSRSALRIAARGPAIGRSHRWMSPTASGMHWLSVHTPHIGGVLHSYRLEASQLRATRVMSGVSNHVIGSRELDLCAWQGSRLLIPDQSRRQLLLLDGQAEWQLVRSWRLPSPVTRTVSLSAEGRWAALLENGGVVLL